MDPYYIVIIDSVMNKRTSIHVVPIKTDRIHTVKIQCKKYEWMTSVLNKITGLLNNKTMKITGHTTSETNSLFQEV